MEQIKTVKIKLYILLLTVFVLCLLPAIKTEADTATAVSFGVINYELLTIQVYNNSNSVVYYSTDNSNWTEVEGVYNSTTKSYLMDISWVATTSEVTLYFKGDAVKTIKSITLPVQNTTFSVDYDKAEGDFTFNNAEESDTFEWRKQSDYNWKTVDMKESSTTYQAFLKTIDEFKVKGASIVIRLPQVIGTGVDNVGMRPSKADTVAITAWSTAPVVKVNSSKLTLNTTASMEYYDSNSDIWIECSSAMGLEDITPQVLYANGAVQTTVKIRKTSTKLAPHSKTTLLTIPAQTAAPTVGDSTTDVTYYSMNSKLILQFNKASSTCIYEYAIFKVDNDFDLAKASWKAVKSSAILTISATTAPEGCSVYVRKKGTDANTSTGISLVLASAVNSFVVDY
jgi:hypothetical protein